MSKFYENILRPILFRFPTETAHDIGIHSLRSGLGYEFAQKAAQKRFAVNSFGVLDRFGLKFSNPLGMAAGFDKNGLVVNQLAALGFGFVEVGTVTLEPQTGNPKPRLFRLPEDQALINRLGFNNDGTRAVVERLKRGHSKCVLGVNIGKNKDVSIYDAIENYLKSFDLAYEVADYIAVNVSSPNTPDLRELQKAENLEELLRVLQERNKELHLKAQGGGKTRDSRHDGMPLLVKIAPDLNETEIEAIVDISMRLGISGIIATNTTIKREGLKTNRDFVTEFGAGGLSGKPLTERSNEVIRTIYRFSKGKLPIIGVGGVFSAEDAFEKITSGACLVQVYTGFVYQGFSFARSVNVGLAKIVKERGFDKLDDAIGSGAKNGL